MTTAPFPPAPSDTPADASPWSVPQPAAAGYGQLPPVPPVMTPAPAPARKGRTAAIILVTGLLAGTAGGVAGSALADRQDAAAVTPTSSSAGSSTGTAPVVLPADTVEKVAAEVTPSVVLIQEQGPQGGGEGSGVVLTSDGLVLTNNHVVAGAATGGSLTVRTQDGETGKATIVGRDPSADLAVIRVSGIENLKPATLGSSATLKVGQSVVAIGAPLGLQGTVTEGIVSAVQRPVTTSDGAGGDAAVLDAIQTDAAINPGNSGGALVDLSGRVVGINSAIATLGSSGGGQSGSIGVGFAIPIDQAKRVADEIVKNGVATRAVLGVSLADNASGARIAQVSPGGAAAKAGLQAGDVVTRVDDRVIASGDDLVAAVRSAGPGAQVTLTYERDGRTATAQVTLGSVTVQP